MGFFRNNDFIKNDDDIDIGIIGKPKNFDKLLTDLINNYNYSLNNINIPFHPYVQLQKYNISIDIEIVVPDRYCVTNIKKCNKLLPYLKKFKTININNKNFYLPTKEYYRFVYGKDWKTPKNEKPFNFPFNIIYKFLTFFSV